MKHPYSLKMNDTFSPWATIPASLAGSLTFLTEVRSSAYFLYLPWQINFDQAIVLIIKGAGAVLMAFLCGLAGSLAKYLFDQFLKKWLDKIKLKFFHKP
jgi:hypothetical protein